MKECKLQLMSGTDGQIQRYCFHGVCAFGDEITVKYQDEGDTVLLTMTENSFQMERRGEASLAMTFEEGKTTAFCLSSGENAGRVPLKTRSYQLKREEKGVRFRLDYEILYSEGRQHFILQATISEET